MNISHFSIRTITLLFLTSVFVCLNAQEKKIDKDFEPQFGQDGKDVAWEPTPLSVVEKMLDIAKVTTRDFVIDLGSGDGRIAIAAAKRGAKARGIEYNQDMVILSRRNAADKGVNNSAEFIQGDLFEADLSKATVITMYLLPRINLMLRPRLLELKPGTRIVSNSHTMGDWIPDETVVDIKDGNLFWKVYLWIIPAKVDGTWNTSQGELKLNQKFQVVSGYLKTGRNTITISEGRLNGDEITLSANGEKYSGRVKGNNIKGTVALEQTTRKWNAKRTGN